MLNLFIEGENPDNVESDDEEDDEDEEDVDAMEPDLDKNEILKHQSGELVGDRLLYTKYSGSTNTSYKKKRVSTKLSFQNMYVILIGLAEEKICKFIINNSNAR